MSQLFFDLCQVTVTKLKFLAVILFKFKSCLNGRFFHENNTSVTKLKEVTALSQKNEQNLVLCPILRFQNLLENFNL